MTAPSPPARVATFLRLVGAGDAAAVRHEIAADPALVSAVGPHPFWGGRPQPLHVAIETTRRDVIDLLLEHGADVNGSNDGYDHWSPLMLALQRGDSATRDALISRGARIGLLEALLMGDDAGVDEQLRAEGLPDVAPNGGSILAFARTPLAIDRLLALGARADITDRWGSAPSDALSRLGATGRPLVAHLVARGVPVAPKEYARLGDRAALERLIAADPSLAADDAVMMGAVDFGHHALVTWLLERGARANARAGGQARQSALHSAAWNGDLPMVQLLVDAGADREARDSQYAATPRGWAETAIEVTANARCADVVAYFDERQR